MRVNVPVARRTGDLDERVDSICRTVLRLPRFSSLILPMGYNIPVFSPPLVNAAPVVPGLGRACLPSSIIGFFYGAFQPHLDQMQYAPINDPARYRFL